MPDIRTERNSNLELLRIVSMFSIVIFHLLFFNMLFNERPLLPRELSLYFFTPFVFIGVVCFVLISGYFGIKGRFKGLLSLYLQCASYAFGIYLIFSLVFKSIAYSSVVLFMTLFPFGANIGLWFVFSYFVLYLIAPLLNKAMDRMSRTEYISILVIYTFYNIYIGYIWNRTDVLVYMFLFIYFYLLGGFIRRYLVLDRFNLKKVRIYSLLCYFLMSSILGGVTAYLLVDRRELVFDYIYRYDNPLVILSSISIFVFFLTLSLKSKFINWVAISSFAVYLITGNYAVHTKIYLYMEIILSGSSFVESIVKVVLFGLFIFVICILIDKIRLLITNPIQKLILRLDIEKKYNVIVDRIDRLF